MEKSNSKVLKGNSAEKTNRETILKLIEDKEGFRNLIAIPRFFIDYTGNLDSAIFLSQLLYWSDNSVRPDGAVYKKYEDWRKEIGLSEYEVKQSVKVLKKKDVLKTKLKKANGAPTLHYYLDIGKLSSSIKEFVLNDHFAIGNQEEIKIPNAINSDLESEETNDSLTETSTQTITDITYKRESELSDDSFASHSELDSGDDLNEKAKDINDEDPTTYDEYWQRMKRLESQGISEKPSHIPKDFEPDENMMFWAKTRFPTKLVGRATEKFINYFRDNQRKSCDWKAKWKEWIENERVIQFHLQSEEHKESLFSENLLFDLWFDLFEDFIRYYSTTGLVPIEKFYKGFPHLTPSVIDEALGFCVTGSEGDFHKVKSLLRWNEFFYLKYDYEASPSYREAINREIVALSAIYNDGLGE